MRCTPCSVILKIATIPPLNIEHVMNMISLGTDIGGTFTSLELIPAFSCRLSTLSGLFRVGGCGQASLRMIITVCLNFAQHQPPIISKPTGRPANHGYLITLNMSTSSVASPSIVSPGVGHLILGPYRNLSALVLRVWDIAG